MRFFFGDAKSEILRGELTEWLSEIDDLPVWAPVLSLLDRFHRIRLKEGTSMSAEEKPKIGEEEQMRESKSGVDKLQQLDRISERSFFLYASPGIQDMFDEIRISWGERVPRDIKIGPYDRISALLRAAPQPPLPSADGLFFEDKQRMIKKLAREIYSVMYPGESMNFWDRP